MIKNCPICESSDIQRMNRLYDDRYGYSGIFELLKCTSCHHKFLDHQFTANELGNLYSNFYPRSSIKIEDYAELKFEYGFKSWFDGVKRSAYTYVPEHITILDIGCGFGQSLGYHKNRGCEVFGVEADENIKRVADKFGFNVKVGLFDPADYPSDFFDYITMDQVIEHVTDPMDTVTGIASILKPGGHAILSTPNSNGVGGFLFGKKWINWHAPYHLQHFSKKSLTLAAQNAGLEIESIKTVTSSEWLHYQWLHLITFPKLGEKSIFWNPKSKKISTKQKIIMKLLRFLHKIKVNHILTRLFDAIGIGDNTIIILKKPV